MSALLRVIAFITFFVLSNCESNCPTDFNTHYVTNLRRLNDGRLELFTDQGVYVIDRYKAKRLLVPCIAELKISSDGTVCSVRRVFTLQ